MKSNTMNDIYSDDSCVADATRECWDDRARGLKHHGYNHNVALRQGLSANLGTICTLVG